MDKDFDIVDGKYIFTAEYHLRRGACCGNGCINCPFNYEAVKEPKKTELLNKRNMSALISVIILNGIRMEIKEFLGTTPAGAGIYKCTVYNTRNGEFKKTVAFLSADKTFDISDKIPKWVVEQYNLIN